MAWTWQNARESIRLVLLTAARHTSAHVFLSRATCGAAPLADYWGFGDGAASGHSVLEWNSKRRGACPEEEQAVRFRLVGSAPKRFYAVANDRGRCGGKAEALRQR